jgi:hypothetical protein
VFRLTLGDSLTMMLRKTSDPRKTSLDPAFEQTEAGMGARALWFQTAMLPSIGTAQHTALVSYI